MKKLIVRKCSIDDIQEYSVVAANVKSSSKLQVEGIVLCCLSKEHYYNVFIAVDEMPPKIKKDTPKLYKVKKNEDVDITVKFAASPKPTDEWTVNGKVITKSNRVKPTMDEKSATLTIKKFVEEDVGDYVLKLANSIGDASVTIKVVMIGTYSITKNEYIY